MFIRSEFYKGKLITPCFPSILKSITQFSEIILPSPDNNDTDFQMQFIGRLLSQEESEPTDSHGNFVCSSSGFFLVEEILFTNTGELILEGSACRERDYP